MSVVCRICLDVIETGLQFFNLNVESDSCAMLLKSKLETCVPEITVDVVKNPVICNDCVDALCIAYKFKKKCMETENKIYEFMMDAITDGDAIDINLVSKWSSNAYKQPTYIPKDGKKMSPSRNVPSDERNYHSADLLQSDEAPQEEALMVQKPCESPAAPSVVNIKSENVDEINTTSNNVQMCENAEIDRIVHNSPENANTDCTITNRNPVKMFKLEDGVLQEAANVEDSDMFIVDEINTTSNNVKMFENVEIDHIVENSPKSANIHNPVKILKLKDNVLQEATDVEDSDVFIASDDCNYPDVLMTKLDLDEQLVDDWNDLKNLHVAGEEHDRSSDMIVSGLTCSYDHFCEFENQFAGYTMDRFYSSRLVALPECSVVMNRLSNEEIEKWTPKRNESDFCGHSVESMTRDSNEMYRCQCCDYSTPLKLYYLLHLGNPSHRQRSGNLKKEKGFQKVFYQCVLCSYHSLHQNSLLVHMQIHKKEIALDSYLKCNICNFRTINRGLIQRHYNFHIWKNRKISLNQLMKREKELGAININTYVYKCIECKYRTSHKTRLRKHYMNFHYGTKPFVCRQCKFSASKRLQIIKHVLRHTKVKVNVFLEHNYAAD